MALLLEPVLLQLLLLPLSVSDLFLESAYLHFQRTCFLPAVFLVQLVYLLVELIYLTFKNKVIIK